MKGITIRARCRIETPMLSSGANQQQFEIRATGVKSGMRFWWRTFQAIDGKALWKAEERLFGSTHQAAPFTVSVHYRLKGGNLPRLKDPDGKELEPIHCWQPGEEVNWGPGLAYTLFPIYDAPRKEKTREDGTKEPGKPARIKPANEDPSGSGRPAARPGGHFLVNFHVFKQEVTEDLLCAFWALANLGGLGGRTRRGAGSFDVEKIWIAEESDRSWMPLEETAWAGKKVPSFKFEREDAPEDYICRGIRLLQERWNTASRTPSYLPPHTAFSPESAMWVLYDDRTQNPSADTVHGEIMKQFRNYCQRHPYDEAKTMHAALASGGSLPHSFIVTKAAKGLPIVYNFSNVFENLGSGRMKKTYTLTTVRWRSTGPILKPDGKYEEGSGRRASPLFFSCHRKQGFALVVVIYLPAPLTAPDEKLWLKGSNHTFDPPDFGFLNDLLKAGYERKKSDGTTEFVKPLIRWLPKCVSILPHFEKLSPETPKIDDETRRPVHIPEGQLNAEKVRNLLDIISKLEAEGREDDAAEMANELKERLRNESTGDRKVWKKFKNEIEAYLKTDA